MSMCPSGMDKDRENIGRKCSRRSVASTGGIQAGYLTMREDGRTLRTACVATSGAKDTASMRRTVRTCTR